MENAVFWNRTYDSYVLSAKHRNIEFKLSKKYVIKLCSQNCYFCGQEPTFSSRSNGKNKKKDEGFRNGIDRYDNKKGYIKSNVVTCCKDCNKMKGTMPGKIFLDLCKKITDFQSERSE